MFYLPNLLTCIVLSSCSYQSGDTRIISHTLKGIEVKAQVEGPSCPSQLGFESRSSNVKTHNILILKKWSLVLDSWRRYTVFLKLGLALESPGKLAEGQTPDGEGLRWGSRCASLTYSQVMLMRLIQEPYSGNTQYSLQ